MSASYSIILFLCLLMAPLATTQAEDINVGKELHRENCQECHNSEIYERTDM